VGLGEVNYGKGIDRAIRAVSAIDLTAVLVCFGSATMQIQSTRRLQPLWLGQCRVLIGTFFGS